MPLQTSGQISLNDVNVELGNSGTAQIGLGDTAVRDMFGVSSGQISLSNGYGASSGPPIPSAGTTLFNSSNHPYTGVTRYWARVHFSSDNKATLVYGAPTYATNSSTLAGGGFSTPVLIDDYSLSCQCAQYQSSNPNIFVGNINGSYTTYYPRRRVYTLTYKTYDKSGGGIVNPSIPRGDSSTGWGAGSSPVTFNRYGNYLVGGNPNEPGCYLQWVNDATGFTQTQIQTHTSFEYAYRAAFANTDTIQVQYRWVYSHQSYFYISTNGGSTWTQRVFPNHAPFNGVTLDSTNYNWWTDICIDPGNGDIYFAYNSAHAYDANGGIGSTNDLLPNWAHTPSGNVAPGRSCVWKSTDNCVSWTKVFDCYDVGRIWIDGIFMSKGGVLAITCRDSTQEYNLAQCQAYVYFLKRDDYTIPSPVLGYGRKYITSHYTTDDSGYWWPQYLRDHQNRTVQGDLIDWQPTPLVVMS